MGIPPLVTDAARWLVERGHVVDVVTAVPNYPQRVVRPEYRGTVYASAVEDGVAVHRSWLYVRREERVVDKALYETSFATVSLPRVIRRAAAADVVVCVVPSLVAATYAAALRRVLRAAGRRTRLVLWVQDLVLAAAASLDLGEAAERLFALLERVEARTMRSADLVVTCSPGFRDYLVVRGAHAAKIRTILNWVNVDEYASPPPRESPGPTQFLYAGNVGYTQGLDTLVDAARLLGDGVAVRIVGDGNAAEELTSYAADASNVSVEPAVPREAAPALLASAHAHVVIQRRISAGVNLPSKIATCLASSRPIVASIDPATPAAALLRESGGALVVPPEDPAVLAEAMERVHRDRRLRGRLAEAGRRYAERELSHDVALPRLEEAILSK